MRPWTKTRLGELLTIVRGVSYKKEDATKEPGRDLIPILRATNIQQGLVFDEFVYVPSRYVSEEQFLRPGDIVIAASSGSRSVVGKAAQLTTDWRGSFGTFCFGLRPKSGVNPAFLSWFLQTSEYRNQVSELSAGVNINNLKAAHIEGIPISIPSIEEQRRIVAEIKQQFTRLDAGVAALRRTQANLKRYRAAVLKAACEGRLVPTEAELAKTNGSKYETGDQLLTRILTERRKNWQGRGKYKEPAPPETSALPTLPDGWTWVSPEQISSPEAYSLSIGPFGSNLKVSDYTDSGVPLVFVRNIRAARFGGDGTVFVSKSKGEELRAHGVSGGDILITKMGAPPGDACLYPEPEPDAVITADCIKLRLSPLLPQKSFFVHAINSEVIKPQLKLITMGVAQMKVSLGRFSTLAIPLPPLAEQTRIVAEVERNLSVVDELESIIKANLQRATCLRQSILRLYFSK